MQLLLSRAAMIAAILTITPLIAGFVLKLPELRDTWRIVALSLAMIVLVYREQFSTPGVTRNEALAGALLAIIAGGSLSVVYAAWWNHLYMGEYDFFALYMDARIAWDRLDFYEPANYQALYVDMPAPFTEMHPGFKRNVLEVGTKYPPPTMLYLLPFGGLERLSAHIAWVGVSWMAIVLSIALLWRGIFRDRTIPGLLAVAAVVLTWPGTKLTVSLEQMHFTALVLLLAAMIWRSRAIAGFLVACGTLIKPPVAIMAIYLLYARRWPALAVLAISTVILCALSMAVFGWDTFARFFTDNPNLRVAHNLYYEDMNRSLQGTIVRAFDWDFSQGTPMQHPVFLSGAAAITALTALGCGLARGGRLNGHVIALLICFGLLLYPGTQRHYAVLLLAPLMAQLELADRDGWPRWLIAGLAIGIGLFSVVHTLWVILLLWITLLVMIAMRRGVA